MPRRKSGNLFLALPLEIRVIIYPYVFEGVVVRIRAPPEPIFNRRGGRTLGDIDAVAEEAREATTKLKFSRVLGLLLVNRQIHAEVKNVPLNQC